MRWLLALLLCTSCVPAGRHVMGPAEIEKRIRRSDNRVFQGALAQLSKPAKYDQTYYAIDFPHGDVPADRGACADVVVRALRYSGVDLQASLNKDCKKVKYPRISRRDTNIDHRRVLNQELWLKRHAQSLTLSLAKTEHWKAGDIVSWRLQNGQHIGIISDLRRPDGIPYVIHNIWQVAEEDVLTRWKIVGHFRLSS